MSLTPTIYRSTDPGAPLLSGLAGALVTLLDVLLVDGYGTGADHKAGMGWTKAFSGSNVRVYRNSPVTGTGFYLRVDDTTQRSALIRGFSAMTDIDTGADATPSVATKSVGSRWDKSLVAAADGRHWIAVGTEKFFYLFVDTGNQYAAYGSAAMHPHYAGDIASLKPGDRHQYVVSYKGSDTEGSSAIGYSLRGASGWGSSPSSDSATCCFIGRNMSGVPGSLRAFVTASGQQGTAAFGGNAQYPPYPYAANSGLLYAAVEVHEGAFQPRGFLPGLYAPLHRRPFPEMTMISDVGGLPSGVQLLAKGYMLDSTGYNDGYAGQVLIDLTSGW